MRGGDASVFLLSELLLDRPVAKLDEQDLPALIPALRSIRSTAALRKTPRPKEK
jgi:hypothetical protein